MFFNPFIDQQAVADDFLSLGRVFHYAMGKTKYPKVFSRLLSISFSEFLVFSAHELAHTFSSPFEGEGFVAETVKSQAAGLNQSQVMRGQAALHMAHYGTSLGDYSSYLFSGLDLAVQYGVGLFGPKGRANDILFYRDYIERLYPGFSLSMRELMLGVFFQIVDPLLIESAINTAQSILNGEKTQDIPFLRFGKVHAFPTSKFDLTPLGFEYSLGSYLRIPTSSGNVAGRVYARAGSGGGGTYCGAGFDLKHIPFFRGGTTINFGFHYFDQPDVPNLRDNGYYGPSEESGHFALSLGADFPVSDRFSLSVEAAYKEGGFLQGFQLSRGVQLALGVGFQ